MILNVFGKIFIMASGPVLSLQSYNTYSEYVAVKQVYFINAKYTFNIKKLTFNHHRYAVISLKVVILWFIRTN